MRVAVVALVGVSLASCGCWATHPNGVKQDAHGRTVLEAQPSPLPDKLLRPSDRTTAATVEAAPRPPEATSTSNASPVALPVSSVDSLGSLGTAADPLTGRAALNQISARSGRAKLSSLHVENGKSTLNFKYDDGSTGTVTTGDGGPADFRFAPGAPSVP
ncbi:hypothetical protein [Gemmata sp.]|uniref:hypothetical protein n=1 Tax=Gemmata sp. TaxID=1914242 RepID=UPI003F70882A